jgi:ESS family glutamate:Na+ symporter
MEYVQGVLQVDAFRAVTWGLLVFFIGRWLVARSSFLRDFNIPEPVVGGLLMSVALALLYFGSGVSVEFDLGARDLFLVYFFTTIGLNARLGDLISGGRPLALLLGATVIYMVIQNSIGVGIAQTLGLPTQLGLLTGTVSLIGGHGTAIAWSPTFAEEYGILNASEIGVASATFGLILASLMGGPIARHLIRKHDLKPAADGGMDVGVQFDQKAPRIDHVGFMHALLAIHIAIGFGFGIDELMDALGIKLPLFVSALFAGILLGNLMPRLMPWTRWPSRTPSMALLAEVSLGVFLAMSLMSLQLWTLIGLAGPLLLILGAQFLVAASLALFVIFRLMGRNYDAAVISAGFGGISLGSTATAMANMSAVAQRYGPSHLAFVIVPLVAAFFVDLVNAVLIQTFLAHL